MSTRNITPAPEGPRLKSGDKGLPSVRGFASKESVDFSSWRLTKWVWVIALITITVLVRVGDHMPNVAPVAAVALWAGMVLPAPWALVVPLSSMLIADSIIGFASLPITISIYVSYGFMFFIGVWLKKNYNVYSLIGSSMFGAILFYLLTNAAVWWFSGLYVRTWDGLLLSYFYAIPFFRNTFLGDVAYVCGLFLAWQYLPYWVSNFVKAMSKTKKEEGKGLISGV